MGDIALAIFQLDRSVFNMEVPGQNYLDTTQNDVTLREWDIVNANMAGERVRI